ncbi:MAG: hypothetical protein ACREIB_05580, partial [Pseudomonadota bacterium]
LEVAAPAAEALAVEAAQRRIPMSRLGRVGGAALTLPGGRLISLDEARRAHETGLPALMGAV